MTVVDASAVVELLVPTDAARRSAVLSALPEPTSAWLAPDVLTFEVLTVIRRYVLRGALSGAAGWRALQRLRNLPLELIPTTALLSDAWPLHERFAAADSLYAALALRAGEPLLTGDRRLARAARDAGLTVTTLD